MLDFLIVSTRSAKHDVIEIYPKFKISPTPKDLMIRWGFLCCLGRRKTFVEQHGRQSHRINRS